MDDVVNRLSRELADAMAAAVADDHRVEACHEKARAAGYSMKVSLEAVIGFANRSKEDGRTKAGVAVAKVAKVAKDAKTEPAPDPGVMSSNDRRFLRSLRIAADEAGQQVD
ncbi:MAG: hypothetical protein CL477_15040 [Acidobacteria bacterium]|jgi:hypothetical protein|nr:hypothetical protein [Acidobacteriota bacterium]MDP7337754.1 hypothetical protein [Vicinamibacterales bacterium]MDP7479550.1 hypothetical protein [Vicinamibacterales bacterium]MDP7690648.1 hypothetical protein [Vicinamibacterales bacterium]HJN42946.1 hypothetical protein [Vicinamibacterales bacterium]|tara:strand:- start:196 stop:528 length:333 start_codon:yes stop_codon:yes gene_type:complete